MKSFSRAEVAAKFDTYPPRVRGKLLALRELVFRTAAANRALVFSLRDKVPQGSLAVCIGAALTYQLKKRSSGAARAGKGSGA